MTPKPIGEKWTFSYLATETDADFRNIHLKPVSRPKTPEGRDNPWARLYSQPTVSSVLHCYRERPHTDSLELKLNATCNQFLDYPITKEEAVRQKWTKEKKCFCKPVPKVVERQFDHPLRIAPFCEAPTNINYVKLAIECPHVSQTNNGYSVKKENGTFYRS